MITFHIEVASHFVNSTNIPHAHITLHPLVLPYNSIHLAPDRKKQSHVKIKRPFQFSVELHVAPFHSVPEYFTLPVNLITARRLRPLSGSRSMAASLSTVRLQRHVVSLDRTSSTSVHGKNKAFRRLLSRRRWSLVVLPSNQQDLWGSTAQSEVSPGLTQSNVSL